MDKKKNQRYYLFRSILRPIVAMEIIANAQIQDRTIIQSFDNRALQVIHQKYPYMITSLLIEKYDKRSPEEMIKDLGFTPDIYSPEHTTVTDKMISFWHSKKVKVIPWTIDDLDEMVELRKIGVDGIISNYPDRLKELVSLP